MRILLKKIFNWITKMPRIQNENDTSTQQGAKVMPVSEVKKLERTVGILSKNNEELKEKNKELERKLEDLSKSKDFDFVKHGIAIEFGVKVSEVTDEFLNKIMKDEEKLTKKYFSDYEKKHGIKLKSDSKKDRDDVKKKIQEIKSGKIIKNLV